MRLFRFAPVVAIAIAPALVTAASLPIKPGMWETTMTRSNPMMGGDVTETTQECVKETEFDPRKMMEDAQGCNLTDQQLDGDTLTYKMVCDMQGAGQATLEGHVQSDGDSSEGAMEMNANVSGMTMSMQMKWTGRRIGDC